LKHSIINRIVFDKINFTWYVFAEFHQSIYRFFVVVDSFPNYIFVSDFAFRFGPPFIPDNKFEGWSCSVNWFFIFVKQTERAIYVNKDCKMNFNGEVAPIGYLSDAETILQDLEINLTNNTMPVITCKKRACWCGLCAPKAKTQDLYNTMMLSNYIVPQQIEV
jgi:hypothetical protein